MGNRIAAAEAAPNIAFIKYWGNFDPELNIPSNGSISMNLSGLSTRTSVEFDNHLNKDVLIIGKKPQEGEALDRVTRLLDRVREYSGNLDFAVVRSQNNFPAGTGIASSASAFAALSLAASRAAGLSLSESELSRLARLGSGSACRSIPGGFVEWQAGVDDLSSYAKSIAPADHWDLVDCIAVVSKSHKSVSSKDGHNFAKTSPFQAVRIQQAPERIKICREAIVTKDFDLFASIIELDSNMMHAVIMTSKPSIIYWHPTTVTVIKEVFNMRQAGIPVCYTIDAGPNVHVLCLNESKSQVCSNLNAIPGIVEIITSHPGGPAKII